MTPSTSSSTPSTHRAPTPFTLPPPRSPRFMSQQTPVSPTDPTMLLATALTSFLDSTTNSTKTKGDDQYRLTRQWEGKRMKGNKSLFQVLSLVQEITDTVDGGPNFSSRMKLVHEIIEPLKVHLKTEFKGYPIPQLVSETVYKSILTSSLQEYARSRVGETTLTSSLRSLLNTAALSLSKSIFRDQTKTALQDAQSVYEIFLEAETSCQWALEWIGAPKEDIIPWGQYYLICLRSNNLITDTVFHTHLPSALDGATLMTIHRKYVAQQRISETTASPQRSQQQLNRAPRQDRSHVTPIRSFNMDQQHEPIPSFAVVPFEEHPHQDQARRDHRDPRDHVLDHRGRRDERNFEGHRRVRSPRRFDRDRDNRPRDRNNQGKGGV